MARTSFGSLSGIRRLAAVPVVAVLLAAGAPASAQEQSLPGGFTPEQAQGLEQIIHNYLMQHPEVLVKSLRAYQQRQERADAQRQQDAVIAHRRALAGDPDSPVLGNPEGDVLIVEFFDYRCPYCRRVAGNVRRIVADDGNIRLVMKEFPILGPESVRAARAALAATKQGKYEAYHFALMTAPGDMSEAHLKRIAEKVGLDVARLQRDMEAPEIEESLRRNYALAEALSINGTPAFVIGDTLVPGAVNLETLKRLVAEARAKGS
ncbi:MAG: DsbA family protein [Kiloniellaceae bacterium]